MQNEINKIKNEIQSYIFGIFISIFFIVAWFIFPIISVIRGDLSFEGAFFAISTMGIGGIYLLITSINEIKKLHNVLNKPK